MHRGQVERCVGAPRRGPVDLGEQLGHDPLHPGRVALSVGADEQAPVEALVVGAGQEPSSGGDGGRPRLPGLEALVGHPAGQFGDALFDLRHDPLEDRPLGVAQALKRPPAHQFQRT